MEEGKQIINQSNIEETEAIQELDSLSIKGELGELMALYIQDMISKGGSIYKDVLDYLLDMDFVSTEYISAICSFIQDNATLDWIRLIDTVLKTKESETIENFIKEIYIAFKNDMDIQDVKEYVSLAKNPYELHIMFGENKELHTLKKEHDKIRDSIADVNNHLQQKEEEIDKLKKELEESKGKLAESEKRRAYYEKSYKEACKESSAIRDESSKLKVELSNLKKKIEAEQIKNQENAKENIENSDIDINAINEKLEELLLKMGSINEGILCISDHTSNVLEKGFNELLSAITIQLKEELLNNNPFKNQSMINNEPKETELDNNESTYYNAQSTNKEFFSPFDDEKQPINEIEIGEQDFIDGDFDYIGDMSNAGLDVEQEGQEIENPEELEDIKNIIMEENNNESDLPSDEEVTNAKKLLQTGIQSREINKTIKNIEESSPFFLRFKKKIDINKKVKLFNKEKDDVKKRQMILEEAMANNFDKNIIKGLKELSKMDMVSLEFLYQMACNKNTSIDDIMKLNEYVIAND